MVAEYIRLQGLGERHSTRVRHRGPGGASGPVGARRIRRRRCGGTSKQHRLQSVPVPVVSVKGTSGIVLVGAKTKQPNKRLLYPVGISHTTLALSSGCHQNPSTNSSIRSADKIKSFVKTRTISHSATELVVSNDGISRWCSRRLRFNYSDLDFAISSSTLIQLVLHEISDTVEKDRVLATNAIWECHFCRRRWLPVTSSAITCLS